MQRRTALLITSDEIGWIGLRQALQSVEDVNVVGETSIGREAIRLAAAHKPDVILSAARVEQVPAWPLLRDLERDVSPTSKIIVFAARLDPDAFVALDDLDLCGYLLWSDLSAETARHCLAAILDGNVVIGSRQVAQEFVERQCRLTRPRPGAPPLTRRERDVLQHMVEGLSRHEIAAAEGISPRTAERIIAGLEAKLGASTPFVLGVKAERLGLVL
jgi:DNA-binding NarL/FixJ family response regulator